MSNVPSHTPRVEACIAEVMAQHPGQSPAAQARYFEAVHQELAPLARQLETQLQGVLATRNDAIEDLRGQCRRLRRRAAAADRRARWVLENVGRLNDMVRRWNPVDGTLLDYLEHCIRKEVGDLLDDE